MSGSKRVLVLRGMSGPWILGKRWFLPILRPHLLASADKFHQIKRRLLRESPVPTHFVEFAYLPDGSDKIKWPLIPKPYKATHRVCTCLGRHRAVLLLPFVTGFFHLYIMLLPAILNNREAFCLRLRLKEDSDEWHFLENFGIKLEKIQGSSPNYVFGRRLSWGSVYPSELQVQTASAASAKFIKPDADSEIVFITRKPGPMGRHFANEDEILAELESLGLKIRRVSLESISFPEQVRTIATAKVIIAAHGAGLSHLISARHGSKLLEINGDSDVRWHYFRLAEIKGIRSVHLLAQTMHDGSLAVDVAELRKAFAALDVVS